MEASRSTQRFGRPSAVGGIEGRTSIRHSQSPGLDRGTPEEPHLRGDPSGAGVRRLRPRPVPRLPHRYRVLATRTTNTRRRWHVPEETTASDQRTSFVMQKGQIEYAL